MFTNASATSDARAYCRAKHSACLHSSIQIVLVFRFIVLVSSSKLSKKCRILAVLLAAQIGKLERRETFHFTVYRKVKLRLRSEEGMTGLEHFAVMIGKIGRRNKYRISLCVENTSLLVGTQCLDLSCLTFNNCSIFIFQLAFERSRH